MSGGYSGGSDGATGEPISRSFSWLLHDARYRAVRVVPFGDEVALMGLVGDYESKRRLEALLSDVGLRARNCVRVMPDAGYALTVFPMIARETSGSPTDPAGTFSLE